MDFEIIDYLPTPAEKYLGIVRVKAFGGKVTFRFKIMQKKDNTGYFPAPASIKGPDVDNAASYLPSFAFDSTDDREELERAIRHAIKRFVDPTSVHNVVESKAIPIDKQRASLQDQLLKPGQHTQVQRSANGGQVNHVESSNEEALPF
jgi:hypothetical protein